MESEFRSPIPQALLEADATPCHCQCSQQAKLPDPDTEATKIPDERPASEEKVAQEETTSGQGKSDSESDGERHIIIPRVRRHAGRRRINISDSDTASSVSPVRYRGRRAGRREESSTLTTVNSHHELFSSEVDASKESKDRAVNLGPFDREVYFTTNAATRVDFQHWFPLLTTAVPDCWYALFVSDVVHPSLSLGGLHTPPAMTLRPQFDPKPVSLKIPWICASEALRPSIGSSAEEESELSPSLVYLSVEQSMSGYNVNRGRVYIEDRQPMPDLAGKTVIGQPIYRVIRSGSREQAAARAFYNGGGNRFSTVFTCVVKDTGNSGHFSRGAESYERVKSLQELVDDDGTGEKIKVFY